MAAEPAQPPLPVFVLDAVADVASDLRGHVPRVAPFLRAAPYQPGLERSAGETASSKSADAGRIHNSPHAPHGSKDAQHTTHGTKRRRLNERQQAAADRHAAVAPALATALDTFHHWLASSGCATVHEAVLRCDMGGSGYGAFGDGSGGGGGGASAATAACDEGAALPQGSNAGDGGTGGAQAFAMPSAVVHVAGPGAELSPAARQYLLQQLQSLWRGPGAGASAAHAAAAAAAGGGAREGNAAATLGAAGTGEGGAAAVTSMHADRRDGLGQEDGGADAGGACGAREAQDEDGMGGAGAGGGGGAGGTGDDIDFVALAAMVATVRPKLLLPAAAAGIDAAAGDGPASAEGAGGGSGTATAAAGAAHTAPVFGRVLSNASGAEVVAELAPLGGQLLLPRRCRFLMSDITRLKPLLVDDARYECITIDPPWENASARRSRKYATLPNLRLLALPIRQLIKPGGLVALWVTNREKLRAFVEAQLLPAWGLVQLGAWYWVKVSSAGELLGPLDIEHRRPYEVLLLATTAPPAAPQAAACSAHGAGYGAATAADTGAARDEAAMAAPTCTEAAAAGAAARVEAHTGNASAVAAADAAAQGEAHADSAGGAGGAHQQRRVPPLAVLAAVPAQHSRKPPLRRLLARYLPPGASFLEMFSRQLSSECTSWGNEPLRFQQLQHFEPLVDTAADESAEGG